MYTKEVWTGQRWEIYLRAKRADNANYARFQTSAAKWMRTALLLNTTQRVVVISAHFVITQNRAVLA